MKAENIENNGCPQRDSAEHEGYAEVRGSFRSIWKEWDSASPELLEKILERDNLNRAFKRVKARKGAPGVDGMTVDEAGVYFRENKDELIQKIKRGKYTPDPVRRMEIPKPDGGIRKLGIPTIKDRVFQQAITQKLTPIYEPQFSEGSYGYRPGRSAQDGILSPLLANIYLNEFDKEFEKRGVAFVRYEDDIVLLAKSERAANRLLESGMKYLEEKLRLRVNREKSRVVSVYSIQNFKFLGFALGRSSKGTYIRVHPKSWKKMKSNLKELSSRRSVQSLKPALERIKEYMRGWRLVTASYSILACAAGVRS